MIANSNGGCPSAPATTTVNIESIPEVNFVFGNTCVKEEIRFVNKSHNAAGDIKTWYWDFADGGSSPAFESAYTYDKYGDYNVSLKAVTKNGCSDTAIRTVTIAKVSVWAGNDTIIAKGQPLQLNATGARDYQWQPALYLSDPAVNDPVASLSSDMWYYLTGTTAQGCIGHDSISIKVYNGPEVYVPTAFTPNGDKLNDNFAPIIPGVKRLLGFSIYNRWGQLVFHTNTIGQGWNGMLNGKAVPAGLYVWKLNAVDYHDKIWSKNGSVTLIR
jgi:gliding motility-associated-like protein